MKRGLLCDVFTERRSDFNFGSGASEAIFEYYFLSVSPVEANNIRISENLIFCLQTLKVQPSLCICTVWSATVFFTF